MHYVAFFAIIVPLQLLLLVSILRKIRQRRLGGDPDSWLLLTGKVFLLSLAVNIVALLPGVSVAATVIWLVGLMRLSGLDVLSAFILSFTLGVVTLVGMVALARYLDVPLLGRASWNAKRGTFLFEIRRA
jgi:hypothetical protein